jgi:cation transport ATPase
VSCGGRGAGTCGWARPPSAARPRSRRRLAGHLADDGGWLASFTLAERCANDARRAVRSLQQRGLRVQCSPATSRRRRAAGARAGIAWSRGGQSPQDKLDHVAALQRQGRRVAMVGDGMNDGPVLARADLSIAMGQGVPLAQARSDVVVPGGQLDAVPPLLAQARRTRASCARTSPGPRATTRCACRWPSPGWMPPWLAGLGMAASSLFVVVLNAARLARATRSAMDILFLLIPCRSPWPADPRRAGVGRVAWPVRVVEAEGRAHSRRRLMFVKAGSANAPDTGSVKKVLP